MAEFCKTCSEKLKLKFDGFYNGEICEHCGTICQKRNKGLINFVKKFFTKKPN